MFSLLHGLWKYMFTKTEMFTLIVGLDDAGKTTLLEQMKSLYQGKDPLPPSKITPTVGLNCTSPSQTYHPITSTSSPPPPHRTSLPPPTPLTHPTRTQWLG